MRKHFATAVIGLGAGLGITGCGDFLTGPKLSDNPNRPVAATNANLLVASQTNLASVIEGHLGRTICVWMQQCAGTRLQYNSLGQYIVGDDDYFIPWSQIYGTGGLVDLRLLQRQALATDDSAYAGVAKVLEAWFIGTAADVWGDVPYSQAADSTVATPALDPQQQVYAALQTTLDAAIASMNASSPGRQPARHRGPGLRGRSGKMDRVGVHPQGPLLPAHRRASWGLRPMRRRWRPRPTASPIRPAITWPITARRRPRAICTSSSPPSGRTICRPGKALLDLLQSTGDARLSEYFRPQRMPEISWARIPATISAVAPRHH